MGMSICKGTEEKKNPQSLFGSPMSGWKWLELRSYRGAVLGNKSGEGAKGIIPVTCEVLL